MAMSSESTSELVQSILARMDSQDQRIDQLVFAMQTLLNRTTHLGQTSHQLVTFPDLAPVVPPNPACSTSRRLSGTAPLPQRYEGERTLCRGFLNQVDIFLEMVLHAFPSDRSKVELVISLLSGKPLAWANPLWETRKPIVDNISEFVDELGQFWPEELEDV
ncbi:protein LDOC1-like [Rhinophrynus dorsalis]